MPNGADKIREMNREDIKYAARSKKRLRKVPPMLFPYTAEREYVRKVLAVPNAMIAAINAIIPRLRRVLNQAAANRPSFDSTALDEYDYGTEVNNLMSLVRAQYEGLFTDAQLAELARRIAVAVSNQNGRELGKVFRTVLGVDLFRSEPWLGTEMQAFVTQNVSLIKTLPERFFPVIEQKVLAAAQQGISWQELRKDIQKTFGNTRFQAERIARDQIGKFNGQLTQLRQAQSGIPRYVWRTALDERVRPKHQEREGKIFRWDDAPSGGHPGNEINCRCYAEPYFGDLLNEE